MKEWCPSTHSPRRQHANSKPLGGVPAVFSLCTAPSLRPRPLLRSRRCLQYTSWRGSGPSFATADLEPLQKKRGKYIYMDVPFALKFGACDSIFSTGRIDHRFFTRRRVLWAGLGARLARSKTGKPTADGCPLVNSTEPSFDWLSGDRLAPSRHWSTPVPRFQDMVILGVTRAGGERGGGKGRGRGRGRRGCSDSSHLAEGECFSLVSSRRPRPLHRERRQVRLDRLAYGVPDRTKEEENAVVDLGNPPERQTNSHEGGEATKQPARASEERPPR